MSLSPTQPATSATPRVSIGTRAILFIALFILAATAPLWAGQAVWDGPGAILCLFLVLSLCAILPLSRAFAGGSITTAIRFAVLALVLLQVSRASWYGVEIAAGYITFLPRIGTALLIGAVIGTAAILVQVNPRVRWRQWLVRAGSVLVWTAALSGVIIFLALTGPRDVSRYPKPESSPYFLPWKAGATRLCVQSNRGIVSHRGGEEFAYDFAMPVGSDVCAARAGKVEFIDVSRDGHGPNMPNNEILIHHSDGTWGCYFHLKKDGALVHLGEQVERGQVIGASGNVGLSMLPHLHFEVEDARGRSLPTSFADVPGDGIPLMFHRYTSAR